MPTTNVDIQSKILTIDNFLEDPDRVRAAALEQTFSAPRFPKDPFRGGGIAYHSPAPTFIVDEIRAKLKELELLDFIAEHRRDKQLIFQGASFKYSTQDVHKKKICHVDASPLTGNIALFKPEHGQGATEFFRNQNTNNSEAQVPFNKFDYAWRNISDWEAIHEAPLQYNRLHLYNGYLFHGPKAPFFGTTVADSRLTLNLNFGSKKVR